MITGLIGVGAGLAVSYLFLFRWRTLWAIWVMITITAALTVMEVLRRSFGFALLGVLAVATCGYIAWLRGKMAS